MNLLKLTGILLAMALCGASPASAQQIPFGQETHGAWTVNCTRDRMTDRVECTMISMAPGRLQQPRLGLLVYAGADGGPELLVVTERYTPTGGAFRIGRLEAEELKECLNGLCAPWPGRSAPQYEQMKTQPGPVYVRVTGRGPPLEGEVSLAGFAAAAESWEKVRSRFR